MLNRGIDGFTDTCPHSTESKQTTDPTRHFVTMDRPLDLDDLSNCGRQFVDGQVLRRTVRDDEGSLDIGLIQWFPANRRVIAAFNSRRWLGCLSFWQFTLLGSSRIAG